LRGIEIARDVAMIAALIYGVLLFAHVTNYVTFFRYPGNITRIRTGCLYCSIGGGEFHCRFRLPD